MLQHSLFYCFVTEFNSNYTPKKIEFADFVWDNKFIKYKHSNSKVRRKTVYFGSGMHSAQRFTDWNDSIEFEILFLIESNFSICSEVRIVRVCLRRSNGCKSIVLTNNLIRRISPAESGSLYSMFASTNQFVFLYFSVIFFCFAQIVYLYLHFLRVLHANALFACRTEWYGQSFNNINVNNNSSMVLSKYMECTNSCSGFAAEWCVGYTQIRIRIGFVKNVIEVISVAKSTICPIALDHY